MRARRTSQDLANEPSSNSPPNILFARPATRILFVLSPDPLTAHITTILDRTSTASVLPRVKLRSGAQAALLSSRPPSTLAPAPLALTRDCSSGLTVRLCRLCQMPSTFS